MKTTSGEKLLAGRYRLGPLLGQGGMAEVYDGFDQRLARPVAVKLLRPRVAADAGVRERFEAEARAAACLSHPNVVSVYDTGEDDGTAFIVMERLPGETLADRFAAGPVDHGWLRRVAGDVLEALAAAHRAGLVHRDIKPGNILIAGDGCAKVADFGIAKSLEPLPGADLTGAHELLGTPAYLAPERIDGEPATPRCDLYALGVVLYEGLTGAKPFPGTTPLLVAVAVQLGAHTPLREVRPDLPDDLVLAVDKAMERDPSRRFATAADMAAALGVQPGPAPVAPHVGLVGGLPAHGAAPTLRSASVVPPAGGSPTVVLAGAVPPPPRSATGRRRVVVALAALAAVLAVLVAVAVLASTRLSGRPALAAELRQVGEDLSPDDGAAAATVAEDLVDVAEAVAAGGGADKANALLVEVTAARSAGLLSEEAADRVAEVVLRVEGADPALLTPVTTEPPTTQPPPTTTPPDAHAEEGDGDGDDDEPGKPGKVKGRGGG